MFSAVLLDLYLTGLLLAVPVLFVLFMWLIQERPDVSTKEEAEEFIVAVCRVIVGAALWPVAVAILAWVLAKHLFDSVKVVQSW